MICLTLLDNLFQIFILENLTDFLHDDMCLMYNAEAVYFTTSVVTMHIWTEGQNMSGNGVLSCCIMAFSKINADY